MIRDDGVFLRTGGSFSVRTSIPKTALIALGSAVLAVLSGAICVGWLVSLVGGLATELAESSLTFVVLTRLLTLPIFIASLVGVVFFGYSLLFSMLRLVLFRRPLIEIDARGIVDRASALGAGFVPWDLVKYVEPLTSSGQDFIAVTVKDDRELLARQNPVKRLFMRINSRLTAGAAINVPLATLPVSGEELLAEIRHHLDPAAQKRLDKHLSHLSAAGATGPYDA